jgi:polyhydroxyalkanoate synthesis regulator phasin
MTTLEDVRKTIEAVIGNLTPAKAQDLAKGLSDTGAAKEQVSKVAADLLEWSQRSRDRLKDVISREIASQMKSVGGVATQADLDAVKKRVRDLERRAGMTASGRSAAKKSAAKKATAKKTAAKKATAKPAATASS